MKWDSSETIVGLHFSQLLIEPIPVRNFNPRQVWYHAMPLYCIKASTDLVPQAGVSGRIQGCRFNESDPGLRFQYQILGIVGHFRDDSGFSSSLFFIAMDQANCCRFIATERGGFHGCCFAKQRFDGLAGCLRRRSFKPVFWPEPKYFFTYYVCSCHSADTSTLLSMS
jgi:hypothetical protein